MKRLSTLTALTLAATLLSTASTPLHAAQRGGNSGLTMPVTSVAGSAVQFVGTFDLNRFVATDSGVAAVGTITGTLTDALGNTTTVVSTVAIPVEVTQATCDILNLVLGPLHLDLLGLVVDLNQVVLDITAQSGAGNLLGNLLCAIVGLLDSPSGLAQILNQILDILA